MEHAKTADELRGVQVGVYRGMGWKVVQEDGPDAETIGPNGARWFILGADAARLADPSFERRIDELRDLRCDDGERERRCLVDVVTTPDCEEQTNAVLARLGLGGAAHVNVYVTA